MITIHKYELSIGVSVQGILVRKNAKLLKCANQAEHLCVWYEVNTHEPEEQLDFVQVRTGQPMLMDIYPRMTYLDTVLFDQDRYVVHVYQVK